MTAEPAAGRRDGGYALVAPVLAVACFGYLAFGVLAETRGAIALAAGRAQRARLMAAADAGAAMAIHALGDVDQAGRWSVDGRPRALRFDGFALTVTVEDEQDKVPINKLSDQQVRALFAGAGAKAERLDDLVAEFRTWVTDPAAKAAVPPGASQPDGQTVRGGPMLTPEEFALLRGVTPQMFARIAAVTTVFTDGAGGFRPSRAQPLARAAMAGHVATSPDQADLEPAIESQRPDEQIADSGSPIGDPMTVRVTARDGEGGVARRILIVEFTGDPARPYWIRFAD